MLDVTTLEAGAMVWVNTTAPIAMSTPGIKSSVNTCYYVGEVYSPRTYRVYELYVFALQKPTTSMTWC
jgi:hypothetical protein